MKLEIKHLAPYLAYGLMFQCIDLESEEYEELPLTAIILSDGKQDLIIGNQEVDIDDLFANQHECLFPIIRPLSDLIKEIKIDGIEYESVEHYFEDVYYTQKLHKQVKSIIEDERWVNYCEFILIEFLFENHFDVFGLIAQELAIDINTLNETK
jgi:hypothetical protein